MSPAQSHTHTHTHSGLQPWDHTTSVNHTAADTPDQCGEALTALRDSLLACRRFAELFIDSDDSDDKTARNRNDTTKQLLNPRIWTLLMIDYFLQGEIHTYIFACNALRWQFEIVSH